jgi:hypothetical protein
VITISGGNIAILPPATLGAFRLIDLLGRRDVVGDCRGCPRRGFRRRWRRLVARHADGGIAYFAARN